MNKSITGRPLIGPQKLPYGAGSVQMRRRTYWAIYRDAAGRTVQENLWTDDLEAARYLLATKAAQALRTRLQELEAIINETPQEAGAGSRRNHSAARDSRSRANGKKPAKTADVGGTYPRQRGSRKGETR